MGTSVNTLWARHLPPWAQTGTIWQGASEPPLGLAEQKALSLAADSRAVFHSVKGRVQPNLYITLTPVIRSKLKTFFTGQFITEKRNTNLGLWVFG